MISMRRPISICLAVGLLLACCARTEKRKPSPLPQAIVERPNIIFILIDDQRFDMLSCLGHPFLQTPNIDALLKKGLLFENMFVTTSLCSPSRASILTGQYAHKHGVLDNATPLPPRVPIFPEELRKAGYETAFIGKWHMGGDSDQPRPGFDHWISFRGQGVYLNPTLNVNGERVEKKGYVTDLLTDEAMNFLDRPHDKPFFLYLSHKAVHADFVPAERHKGSYAREQYPHPDSMADTEDNYRGKPDWVRAQRRSWHGVDGMYDKKIKFDKFARDYAETLRAVDDGVGRIVESLRRKNLLDSTLIIYTSDNGFQMGEHGLIDKRTMYEASIRVPLIVHWPKFVKPGTRRSEMILNLDFAPTILEAAGAKIPETMQGRSFLPLLKGESVPWRKDFLYEYFWERAFPQTPTVLGVRADRYKLMKFHGVWDRYELYDLQADPSEMNNLLGDYKLQTEGGELDALINRKAPAETKKLFNEMQGRLQDLLQQTGCFAEPSWRKP